MKRLPLLLVLSLFIPALTFAQAADTKPKDQKFLLEYLKQTKQDFLRSIKGLSKDQWNFKAAPERWSVAETAEHITLAEDFLGNNIKDNVMKAGATAEQKEKAKGKEDGIIKVVTDRSRKFQAPEPIKPSGKFADAKAIEKAFKEKRDGNIQWAKSTGADELRNHVAPGPPGELDAYEWLLFMAAHTKRHTLQIEEVKADPKFPKK